MGFDSAMIRLSLLVVFLMALVVSFGTLLLPALAGKPGWKILFKHPAFLIGDFILIPLYLTLIADFLAAHTELVGSYTSVPLVGFYLLASLVVLAVIWQVFHPEKKLGVVVFIPHTLFGLVILLSLFLSVFIALGAQTYNLGLILAYLCIVFHVIISWVYPKRLDGLKGLVHHHE